MFQPADQNGSTAQTAVGRTDDQGKYELSTPMAGVSIANTKGAVPGSYKVTVSRISMPDGSAVPAETTEADAMAEGATESVLLKYSDATTSVLTATIAEGQQTHDFEIEVR